MPQYRPKDSPKTIHYRIFSCGYRPSLSFGQLALNSTSAAQSVTLTNTGNALLSISTLYLGGVNFTDFAQTNTCASSVSAGANCAISVTFTPTDTTDYNTATGSVNVTDFFSFGLRPTL